MKSYKKNRIRWNHLPFMAPLVFTHLINSVATLLGPILPSSKVEAPAFWYRTPCVQRSVYVARQLQDFLLEVWDIANLHSLTHPTFVSTSFSIGHEFSLNILLSNQKKERSRPAFGKCWRLIVGTNRCRWQITHGSRTDIKIFITLRDCNGRGPCIHLFHKMANVVWNSLVVHGSECFVVGILYKFVYVKW